MFSLQKKGFTLVELIVVITILAILGTIAFISLEGYSKNARDSRRVADVNNIKKALEFFALNSEIYPMPDEVGAASYSGAEIYYQGRLGENVTQNLSRNLKEVPRDPVTEEAYIYSVTEDQGQYELTTIYEGSITNHSLTNQTHADLSEGIVYVTGNYNNLYVQTDDYAVPLPSITTAETLPVVLTTETIQSQIVPGGTNKPSIGGAPAQTGSLDINLSVYEGKVDVTSSNTEKIAFVQAIQGAYAGSSLAQGGSIYEEIVSKTSDADLVALVNGVIASTDGEAVPEVLQCPEGQELSGEVCVNQSYTFGSEGTPSLPSNASSPSSVAYDDTLTVGNLGIINCAEGYVGSSSPALGYYFNGNSLIVQGTCDPIGGDVPENAIVDMSSFSGIAGNSYWIKPNNVGTAFQAIYSGPDYKGTGKGYFLWWKSVSSSAPTVNFYGNGYQWLTLMVEKEGGAWGTAGFDTYQVFDERNDTSLSTNGTKTGYRVYFGFSGGHGIYNNTQGICGWGNSIGALGNGYTGSNCGSFPNSLPMGEGTSGAVYQSGGTWNFWFYF